MTKDRLFVWIGKETERIVAIADMKIAIRMQAAVDALDYDALKQFVEDAENLTQLKIDFLNHLPEKDMNRYTDYLRYFVEYAEKIEEF